MVGEWSSKNLGDCAVLVRDTASPAEVLDAPYVGLEHIAEGTLSLVGHGVAADVTSTKFRFRCPDILFGKLRPYFRKVVMAPFDGVCSTDIWVVRARDAVEQRFLFYYMASPDFVGEATRASEGTKMPRAQWSYLSQLPLPLPPLLEQRAIARILGTLDDKIELNRRMNATLEAMARAIFTSWFVDFDPVHAKARGEQPAGMDAETAALFPDSFEESELGMIPRGWRVGVLANMIEINSGGTPKTSIPEYWDGDVFWFSVKDAPSDSDVFVIETKRTITQAGIDSSTAKILSEGTSIVTARGTVGKLALVGVPMAMNQSCYGIRGIYENSNYYTFFLLRSAVADLQKNTHGTVFDTITRKTFLSIRVISPQVETIWAFDNLVGSLLERIKLNLFEYRTLAALRDTLLPKLISGEVRVEDIEGIVAELE